VKSQLAGHDEPTNDEQQVSLAIYERLPTDWLSEDDFLERLAAIAGLDEPWQSHDVTATFAGLHASDYVEVRRISPQLRQVRRSPERPRFYTFQEQAEADQAAMVIFQREEKERADEAERERKAELEAPQRQADREELASAIDDSPRVRELREEISDLEGEVRGLRAKVQLLEAKLGGTTEGQ
jgi:hypothetical protein